MLAVIFRNRYFVNTAHLAICKQEAVLLVARRKFRGVQLASAGYYLSRRIIYVFEPLRPLYQATHLLKITAHLLLTYYSISDITSKLRKRKAYTWEVAEARMRPR